MSAWYAIRTVPVHRIEFQVFEELNYRKPESAMVPFEVKWERRRGSKYLRPRKYAIFPCYVFVNLNDIGEFVATKVCINQLAEAKGKKPPIVALVGYGARPSTLAPTDVSFLKTLVAPEPTTVAIHKALQAGQQATIVSGAFQGQSVRIDSVNRKKVKVLLNLLNSMQSVEIDAGSLVAA